MNKKKVGILAGAILGVTAITAGAVILTQNGETKEVQNRPLENPTAKVENKQNNEAKETPKVEKEVENPKSLETEDKGVTPSSSNELKEVTPSTKPQTPEVRKISNVQPLVEQPKLQEVVKTEKVVEEVDFNEVNVYDKTKFSTYNEITVKGEKGLNEVEYQVTYLGSEEISRKEISRKVTKSPTSQIRTIGTIVRKVDIVYGNEIKTTKDTVEFKDENLLVGKTEVVDEGQDGIVQEVFEVEYHDGVEVSRVQKPNVVKQELRNKRVAIGVREEKEVFVRDVETDFKVITIEDDTKLDTELPETRVQGEKGLDKIYTKQVFVEGKLKEEQEVRKTIRNPRNEEKVVGILHKEVSVEEKELRLDPIRVENLDLPEGTENEVDAGEVGKEKVTTTTYSVKGQVKGTPEVVKETLKPARAKRIEYNAHKPKVQETITYEPISITEEVTYDENQLVGYRDVTFDGEEGQTKVVTRKTTLAGEEIGSEVQKTEHKPMKPRQVVLGSKQVQENARVVTRTVNLLGLDAPRQIVDRLNFTKVTWLNNDRVEWIAQDSNSFAAINYPSIPDFRLPDNAPQGMEQVTGASEDIVYNVTYIDTRVVRENVQVHFKGTRGNANNGNPVYDKTITMALPIQVREGKKVVVATKEELFANAELPIEIFNYTSHNQVGNGLEVVVNGEIAPFDATVWANAFDKMSEDARFNLAQHYANLTFTYGYDPLVKKDLTQQEIDVFVSKLDKQLLQEETLKLVNAERKLKGLNDLELAPELFRGTQLRADEQAELGTLYGYAYGQVGQGVPNLAHSRPNGLGFTTAFINDIVREDWGGFGENIAQQMSFDIPYLISEKYLAKTFYEQFKASEGHYNNMMSASYTHIAFGFGFADNHYLMGESQLNSRGNGHIAIAVQVLGIKH